MSIARSLDPTVPIAAAHGSANGVDDPEAGGVRMIKFAPIFAAATADSVYRNDASDSAVPVAVFRFPDFEFMQRLFGVLACRL